MATVTPETVPGRWDGQGGGFLIDGSSVQWWGLKKAAREAAKSIGWPMSSIWPVHTRFQEGYALHQTHGGFLTRAAFAALAAARKES